MPQLRSSKPRLVKTDPVKSTLSLPGKIHLTEELFKEEYDKLISKISTSDIKKCLKSSCSEAKFYMDICNEELNKLKEEKDVLDKQIKTETDINKRKDSEAAKMIKQLWEEAHKMPSKNKKRSPATRRSCLKPEDVKRVWNEAKKLSNQAKQKRRKLVAQRNQLDAKICLAKQAVQFCRKFGKSPAPKKRGSDVS